MSAFAECPSVLLDVTFVLQLQPSMRLEHISDSVIDFTGYSAAEYAAKPRLWLGAVDPRDRQLMLSAFNAAQTELTTMNLRFRTRDGDSIWAHQISRTVRTPDGMVLLYGSLTRIRLRRPWPMSTVATRCWLRTPMTSCCRPISLAGWCGCRTRSRRLAGRRRNCSARRCRAWGGRTIDVWFMTSIVASCRGKQSQV